MSTPRDPRDPELDAALEDRPASGAANPDRVASARRTLDVVDALPAPAPSPHLRRRLLARLDAIDEAQARSWPRRLGLWLRGPAGGGLAAAAAAAAGILLAVALDEDRPDKKVPEALARMERLETAENLELYENLEVVEHLDVIEDLELIAQLPEEESG
jgi:hypothetical protein